MKKYIQLLGILIILAQISCIFPNDREKERERKRQQIMNEIPESESEFVDENDNTNTTDYSNVEISKDSLDLVLYELIADYHNFSEDLLLRNIESLLNKGAKPDAIVETTYMVRKTGTYIPIIKHFYKNKYREHTKISTSMHAAVETGNIKVVKTLLEHGGNINVSTPYGTYPIDVALQLDNLQMIDFLINSGVKIKNVDLANSKNTTMIEKMVKLGADPNTIDINYALADKSELKRLLALHPSLKNMQLDMSILMKDDELLNLLLDNGLPYTTKGTFPDECPLLFAAIKYDNFNAFKKLHEMGASITEVCKAGFGDTPLQAAIYYQRTDALKYLLAHKANPNEKDWTKKSALIMACNTDNDEIINILVDAGAQIEYTGYFNKTPLMHAVEYDKYISADALISRKANVNYKNRYGMTSLFAAIKKNNFPMIKLLVDNGARTDVKYETMDIVQFAEKEEAAPAVILYLKKVVAK